MLRTVAAEAGDASVARVTNESLKARRDAAIPRGIANVFQVYAGRAENAQVWDVEGREYIDFATGIAVLATGHRHPVVMERVRQQAERFTHTCFQVLPYEGYVELTERLNAIVPISGMRKTALFSTGAEAIENALKIARYHTGRPAFISCVGGFHGRTMMALALTGKVPAYKSGFGPFPPDVYHIPYADAGRGVNVEASRRVLGQLFQATIDPRRVAAIVMEPVQGEGGFYAATTEFVRMLREVCDEHGILLIADEIQTGFARTGRMFAMEHFGVEADIVVMAKSLAGGFPLSAVTGRADIMDSVPPGGLGSTYAGNPLACAAALGVLDVIEAEDLCARARELGEKLVAFLSSLKSERSLACIANVRALGAMAAIEICHDGDMHQPAPASARRIIDAALGQGLILLTCGPHSNVLRFLLPLTITDAIFAEGLQRLKRALLVASG
jgi:4-aminobutyrate aminotransferase